MNIVHWSVDLQLRAEMFLKQCRMERDFCQYVGPAELQVNENYLFYQGKVSKKWPARLVRKWFNEFGYRQSWDNFYMNRSQSVGNFSHLIYPLVQLIGCNAAHLPSGHYMFVCYYWPRTGSRYKADFLFGAPCSQCNPKVPVCSRIFKGLCGIDIEISKSMTLCKAEFSRFVGVLLLLILFN
ncbi:uncharacterized protein LOC118748789 [Rhagoletis pomonella]|uniref:uncharacterized protein LOC118748789 n=1 Tax=Rhagoletis pomonella TaxID=28610 RepID=UPI00178019CD|nr:uncharacterized protein LOC118748789 [Rhagoletis pomonella]